MSGRKSDDAGQESGGAQPQGCVAPADPYRPRGEIDPGDAVPEGVAPLEPVPLTEEEQRVLEKLRNLPKDR